MAAIKCVLNTDNCKVRSRQTENHEDVPFSPSQWCFSAWGALGCLCCVTVIALRHCDWLPLGCPENMTLRLPTGIRQDFIVLSSRKKKEPNCAANWFQEPKIYKEINQNLQYRYIEKKMIIDALQTKRNQTDAWENKQVSHATHNTCGAEHGICKADS